MFESLDQLGGIYVAMFAVAVISGVFPLVNSEVTLTALALLRPSWPEVLALAVITAAGQTITHATLFQSSRGLTKLGAKKRPRLEAKIAKAHAVIARWQKSELLLIVSAATIGLPPMVLVALVAGALEVRFRTFVALGFTGRIARFTLLVVIARAF